MRNKLPVCIENRELPVVKNRQYNGSYGYVNILLLLASVITTIGSIITIIIFRR